MIRIAVNGCCGKMGRRILELGFGDGRFEVVAAFEKEGHPLVGSKIEDITISDNPDSIRDAEVVIDFSTSSAAVDIAEIALRYKKPVVIGTTALSPEQVERIKKASSIIPVVLSPNMSVGVNLLFRLVKEAAAKLKDYRINIMEAHHIHKKDAPSGTAKKLAELIREQIGRNIEDIKAIRENEIIGDHEVKFDGDLDTITLGHSAKSRDIFAQGALEAAAWVIKQPPGFYSMQDVLGK